MTTTKKIIILILVLGLIGAGVYWYLYGQATTPTGETQNGGFSIRNFLPFGNPDDSTNFTDNPTFGTSTSSDNSFQNNNTPIPTFRKLWDKPIAGAIIFNTGSTSVVRFIEKATGNIYEAHSDSLGIKRLTNDTIPKIMRGEWLPDASGFIAQSLDNEGTVNTSFIKLRLIASSSLESLTPYETVISNLPLNIAEITVSPDSKKVFYYVNDQSGAKGYVSNPDGTSASSVFSNYLTSWIPQWFSGNSVLMSTKANFDSNSFGYVLNTGAKTMTRIYGNIIGGSAKARSDGKYVLLGQGGESMNLLLLNSTDGSVTDTQIKTLPEKCAWDPADAKFVFCAVPNSIPDGDYPDSWYKGLLPTNDLIEKINVFDLYKYVLADPKKEVKTNIDVQNMYSSKDGSYLIFTNKTDQSLWMLSTK